MVKQVENPVQAEHGRGTPDWRRISKRRFHDNLTDPRHIPDMLDGVSELCWHMVARVSHLRGALLTLAFGYAASAIAAPAPPGPLAVARLGDAPVALAGPWSFRPGDDVKWADPQFDDLDWERLSADRTWARQGHFKYTGFAWYRLHAEFQQDGVPFQTVSLLIPHVDDAYELYWNGVLVARNGKFPPNPLWPEFSQPPRIVELGSAHQGVLAFRVWKAPLLSDDSGLRGGFEAPPLAGTSYGIAMYKALLDYQWLRGRQLSFGLNSLFGIIGVLTLIAWTRNRQQWPLFWMAGFALSRILFMIFYGLRLPWPLGVAGILWQPFSAFRGISLSFLLLWLLQLRQNRPLVRLTLLCAWASMAADTLDGLAYLLVWKPGWTIWVQLGDGVLTGVCILLATLPLVLVVAAVSRRERLNKSRWLVAICAFLAGMVEVVKFASEQGSRFTHWTLSAKIDAPLLIWNGNEVSLVTVSGTLLLLASAFAVYRSFEENRRRQLMLNQEFDNARALQQVLIPEESPRVPGFRVSSAYRPALDVGGDFFQIIPIGNADGSTFIILGDVSGKGLKAAMAVSFIVGSLHAFVERISSPATLLEELNKRLLGRLQNGFTTCLALRLERDGRCSIAAAGHPAPFVDAREIEIKSGLPLGLFAGEVYEEVEVILEPGETCMLYTDGLTEARSKSGELFGEERLEKLFAVWPTAQQAAEAAIQFGQDDDVTVLSFTRLKAEVAPTQRVEGDANGQTKVEPGGVSAVAMM
jgi:hypothetical protein